MVDLPDPSTDDSLDPDSEALRTEIHERLRKLREAAATASHIIEAAGLLPPRATRDLSVPPEVEKDPPLFL
jgi:hypothetical protein